MLRLLSSDYKKLLEHGLCQYYRQSGYACCHQTIIIAGTWFVSFLLEIMLRLLSSDYYNSWNIVFASIIEYHASPVVIRL